MRKSAEDRMAAALGGRSFAQAATTAAPAAAANVVKLQTLKPGEVHVGDADGSSVPIGVNLGKLIDGRLLVQGASGAGKSWTLRRLLEQTRGLVQQIIVDPEGEFAHFADELQILRLEGHRLDMATLALAGARAREHRASLVLDLSQLDRDDQMKTFTAFVTALIAAPREHWHPALVAIDEAHLFAPFGGYTEATHVRKASVAALTDLMSRGRKRGLAGVVATQRLARLAKSVVSEALNFMVGLNTLDLDIRRASETIGWDASKGFDRLPLLRPGEFVAVGPAFTASPCLLKVGAVATRHVGAAPEMRAPIDMPPADAARLIDLDSLLAATAAGQETLDARARAPGLRHVRAFIRDPAFADAGRVWGALLKLAPDGARVKDLASHLNRKADQVAAALALLDQFGVLQFDGEGDGRAVRVESGMRP